jgi:phenylalanyl-tRNA synthetase alpha chain
MTRKHLHYSVSKGPQFATEVKQLETDLTVEMLASWVSLLLHEMGDLFADGNRGTWKDSSFKQYNFAAAGQPPEGGALHPLLKMREEMRQIFFDMGYVILCRRKSHCDLRTSDVHD